MVKTLIVINGEDFWGEFFPDFEVHYIRLQASRWLLHHGRLTVFDIEAGKAIRVDRVLWRGAPVRPFSNHQAVLEMIRFAGVPCLNSAQTLLRGLHRLSMLTDLHEIGLPVVPFSAMVGSNILSQINPVIPGVIKVGDYHAGYGKMLLSNLEQWQDMKDLIYVTDDYFTVEPFIDYKRDIRCLAVGQQVWALARNGSHWKANVGVVENQTIPAPEVLSEYTQRAMNYLKADLVALDFLETTDGNYVLLECNDVPGLAGFPRAVIEAVAVAMMDK